MERLESAGDMEGRRPAQNYLAILRKKSCLELSGDIAGGIFCLELVGELRLELVGELRLELVGELRLELVGV